MSYPSALDLHRQATWEMEGVRRAAARYREAARAADPASLPAGRRLLRELVKPLIALIQAAQAEAQAALTAAGRQEKWCWPVQLFCAEQLAVATVCTGARYAILAISPSKGSPLALASQAETLASALRDQLEFDRWSAEQEQANAEAKRRKDEEHENLLGRLRKRYPNLDRRVWAKWRRKLELLRAEPWGKDVDVALGAKLFAMLAEAAPQYFKIGKLPLRPGVFQYRLELTEEGLTALRDTEARAEVARPMLMPMLMPPNPWSYDA